MVPIWNLLPYLGTASVTGLRGTLDRVQSRLDFLLEFSLRLDHGFPPGMSKQTS
jgi:hypothetical protein